MSRIALVGLGLVGRAWAISFARAGHEVALFDERPEAIDSALSYVDAVLPDLEANGLLMDESQEAVRARMRPAATLEEALGGASHVQENTPEDVEVKRRAFPRPHAAAAAETVLASSPPASPPSHFTQAPNDLSRSPALHPIH